MIETSPVISTKRLTGGGDLIAWLAAIGEQRDLSLAPPAGDERAIPITLLLETLSAEFADFRAVVSGAREGARRNAANLRAVAGTTAEQDACARSSADAAAEAEGGAVRMGSAVDALHGLVGAAAASAADAGRHLGLIHGALTELHKRLAHGDAPLAAMRRSIAGIANFLGTLARLSRHAQLLSVNASIEAAHLGDAGARFAIVADQVRRLSLSTRDSKVDVAGIVEELRKASAQISLTIGESNAATTDAAGGITASAGALDATTAGIEKFATMVAGLANATNVQSSALEAVNLSIAQIAHHADEAAAASRRATDLDLDSRLDGAQTTASRWKLYAGGPAADISDVGLGSWIRDICAGADPRALTGLDADAELRPVVDAVRSLIERVNTEEREILGDVISVAVAVSSNGYAWRSIAEALDGVSREIRSVRATVGESVTGAQTSFDLGAAMRSLEASIRDQYDRALDLLNGALDRIARITSSVETIDASVASMSTAAARADKIMSLIETLASETDLLSLNAAIEAAHAGELGMGFSVIAEEIRALAHSTNDSTTNVSQLVAHVATSSTELQTTIAAAAASTGDVVQSADGARQAIEILRDSFESAEERALDVATIATEQARRLDRVIETMNRSASAAEIDAASTTDRTRLELAVIGARAHAIAARRPLGTVVDRVRTLAGDLCCRLEAAIETALAAKSIPIDRIFDLSYREIAGDEIRSLARLFDVSRVPDTGFQPAKFATPWDALIDEAMIAVLSQGWDEAVNAKISPVAIFVSDLNGFFYAYPRQKIAAWTNDAALDLAGNRIKRLFEDEYALRVGRWGLGRHADGLGPRTPYETFRGAGCDLRRTNHRPWGGYVYARDTSLVCNEVVMAIYAGDMRHSTLRLCYDATLV